MSVSPTSPFRSLGNTDRIAFWNAISRSVSGGTSPMRAEADAIYAALFPHGLTRLGAAMAWIERSNETDPGGLQYYGRELHNAWAVKNPPAEQASKGVWRRYGSYAEAAADWGRYILGPIFADLETLGQFIRRYAPSFDGNNPADYGRKAAQQINALPRLAETEEPPMPEPSTLPFRQGIIPAGRSNRPGIAMNAGGPRYLTVHETGNTSSGATAEMHRRFVDENRGGPDNVSFHLVVDDREAIQLLPFTEIGYHASDGCDNRTTDLGCFDSLAIETCVNADGVWEKTLRNLILLMVKLIRENPSVSADRIRQHNTWAFDGKNCPERIRREGRFTWLVSEVKRELTGAPVPGFVGLPSWLPGEYFKAAFPSADPNGAVTRRVIRYITETKDLPVFVEKRDVATGKNLWVFDRVTFLNDGNRVWLEGEAA